MFVAIGIITAWLFTYACYNLIAMLVAQYKIRRALRKVQGPTAHWFFGNTHQLSSPEQFLDAYQDFGMEYPRKFVLWYGPLLPAVSVTHPETIRAVIKSKNIKEGIAYQYLVSWLGRGILLENGHKWTNHRRLITPAFHFEVLQSYVAVFCQCTDIFINKLNNFSKSGKCFNILERSSLLSFDILLQCAYSLDLDCQRSGSTHPFVLITRENTKLVEERYCNLLHYNELAYRLSNSGRKFYANCQYSHRFSEKLISNRQQQIKNGTVDLSSKKRFDFIDVLLAAHDEEKKPLKIEEIRNEVENFLFAGHDTISSAISWTLYCLAKYPKCQQKVWQEVSKVLDNNDELNLSDLSELRYTTMCIKEAIRLHSTIPIILRTLAEDIEIDNTIIPAGTMMEIAIYVLHHNPEIWPSPWKFDPDRFLPENCEGRDPYAYIPFSIGPRNCIGQVFAMNEVKVVIAKTISQYFVQIDTEYSAKHMQSVVLKSVNGLWLKVKKRH